MAAGKRVLWYVMVISCVLHSALVRAETHVVCRTFPWSKYYSSKQKLLPTQQPDGPIWYALMVQL